MAKEEVKCDEGYWSSGSDEDDDAEPNYCFMATNNNSSGRSIIEQVRLMISENNFNANLCEPYLTQMTADLSEALKAYRTAVEDREEIHLELTRLRSRFEDRKLKIDLLAREIVMLKDEVIISNDKADIAIAERNVLLKDNVRLNTAIEKLHSTMDRVDYEASHTHNF